MRENPFIDRQGIMYQVERSSEIITSYRGLINREQSTGKRYISFHVGTDIQVGDWLISPHGDKFYVTDKETAMFADHPHDLRCMVQSEAETKQSHSASPTTIFNISSATGSIIGTQTYATINYNDTLQQTKDQIASSDSPDKPELLQIVALLEMVVNNQVPPQKGLFSKFAGVMERNSWITGSISSALLSWLMTQI